MKRKHAHAHKKTDKTQLLSKKHSPCFDYDFSMYDVSNEWLPYETANSNESELSAEEQLLKECTEEHKNQVDLGTVDCTPKPAEKAYSASVVEELIAKLEVAEAECARLKKRADLAECKTWDSSDAVTALHSQIEKLQAKLNFVERKNELLNQLMQSGSKSTESDEAYKPKPAPRGYALFAKNDLHNRFQYKSLTPLIDILHEHYAEYATDTILKDICGQLHVNDVAMFENYYIVRC